MKQDFRSYFLVKAVALLLTVACAVAAVFSWVYAVFWWDPLFDDTGDYNTYSVTWSRAMSDRYSSLFGLLESFDAQRRGQSLGYLEQQIYQERRDAFAPTSTNFRYIIRDNATGEILLSSYGADSLEYVEPGTLTRHIRTISPSQLYYSYRQYDEEADVTIFFGSDDSFLVQMPGDTTIAYEDGATYQYAIEFGVDARGQVHDEFWDAAHSHFVQADIRVLYLAIAASVAFLAGTVFLMCCAGRRRGADTFTPNWTDKIPFDLYLLAMGCAVAGSFVVGLHAMAEQYFYYLGHSVAYAWRGLGGILLAVCFALTEAILMSTATRFKTHTLLRNTIVWKLCKLIGRAFRALWRWWEATFGAWSITARLILVFSAYVVLSYLSLSTIIGPFLLHGGVLFLLCRYLQGWKAVRAGTAAIVNGHPDTAIDTDALTAPIYRDLREHAEDLNDLGGAINSAVNERLKSERMKAELITNVSHDLKTPLTSIINYVDLLKKEDIQGEKAQEYLEVLDRKSQRLKKLTEDLVEASKASTGALPVSAERLGVVQLLTQALGEYSEKFAAANLTTVVTLTEEEVYVMADGRHFWRIIDNLLGNCVKYALPGTRVYLDLVVWDGHVTFSVKNISASQLNIPAEQLLERFVRGDESRTTEGSGLGLSIARSLTELQGGTFRLEVDGDLFKAVVSFPAVQ